jgi:hypothetical protein
MTQKQRDIKRKLAVLEYAQDCGNGAGVDARLSRGHLAETRTWLRRAALEHGSPESGLRRKTSKARYSAVLSYKAGSHRDFGWSGRRPVRGRLLYWEGA